MSLAVSGLAGEREYRAALAASRLLITTDPGGRRIFWRRWGDGPAVVLVHGGFGSWTHWLRNVLPLSRDYTVLAPDIPGMGQSDLPAEQTGPAIAAALVEGLDSILGGGRVKAIVGFSFGGAVSGRMIEILGDSVDRCILVGAGGLGIPRTPPLRQMQSWRRLETREEVLAAHRFNLSVQMIHDEALIDDLAIRLQDENTRAARLKSRPITHGTDMRHGLARAGVALAGIWGEFDATSLGNIDSRRRLLAAIDPDCEFTVFDGVGHWVQYEAPERFNARVLELLATDRRRRAPVSLAAS